MPVASDSRTEGSSNAGVTTTTSPAAGMIAAVVRSERHQRMPVKYSSVAPASTSSAPTLASRISPCTLAMRARRSSTVIGLAEPVSDFRGVPETADAACTGTAAPSSGATAPAARNARLETISSPDQWKGAGSDESVNPRNDSFSTSGRAPKPTRACAQRAFLQLA